jgi:4,5-DOPA dioxygenase extradiol
MTQPVFFISHGSPELALRKTPAHQYLKTLGGTVLRPRAILMISAHWETDEVRVGSSATPETIYDFGGFDPKLREIVYAAPAASDVARDAHAYLEAAGIPVSFDPACGYDHGVWVPLHLVFPQADIPIAQISIQPQRDPRHHYRIGQALRELRDDGVLLIASGAMTHNLHAFAGQRVDAPAPNWVSGFNDWFAGRLAVRDLDALLDYRTRAPFAVKNHPTDEHLLPIFTALGAARDDEAGERIHASYEHGVIAMDIYRFG